MNVTETLHKEFTCYCQRLCGEQGRQTANQVVMSANQRREVGMRGARSEQAEAEPGRT